MSHAARSLFVPAVTLAAAAAVGVVAGVVPAKAGTQRAQEDALDSRLRGNDVGLRRNDEGLREGETHPRGNDDSRRPGTLHRLVRHFDFEEAELAPYEMPLNWYRYAADDGATAQGFPPFGHMRLTNEVAYTGRWSFEFQLDGGSLAARVPTAVIPIMPMADYVVLTRVRTQGLTHARAGLAAWLHDQRGNAIEGSRVQSRMVKTDGEWDTLAVHVRGRFEEAADLVIELQLLQPRQFVRSAPAHSPLLEDVRGRAWFDDVTVWHVPHVDMVLTQPEEAERGKVAPARLTMMVLDLAHDDLEAHLKVVDLDGQVVFDHHFPAPRTPIPRSIDVPLDHYGWYRAVLDITHEGEVTARRALDFIHAPPRPRRTIQKSAPRTVSFALAMPESWRDHADETPAMARQASVQTVILPVLTRQMRLETAREMHRKARPAIEALRRDHVEVIFALSSMPEGLARHLGVTGDDILLALRGDDAAWGEYLDELLINFAFEVDRWQIGPAINSRGRVELREGRGHSEAFWHHDLPKIVQRTRDALAKFVPEPVISLPLSAEYANMAKAGEDGRTVMVPYAVRPESFGYLNLGRPLRNSFNNGVRQHSAVSNRTVAGDVIAVLEQPPAELYEPRERVADLAFRMLYAWREGIPTVAIAPPWTPDQDGRLMPEPTLGAWRTMAAHLAGRRFAGDLALGPGLHAWILEGADRDDAAIVAWSDRRVAALSADRSPSFTMQLAEGAVDAVDLFGNVRSIPLRGSEHTVHLSETPIFIEGISAPLVKFRGNFSLDPPLIPSELRAHEHSIVLRNPWDMPVTGAIQLVEDPRWRMTPRTQQFTIRPREEVRLPVQIVLDRGITAGRKKLRANITLSAEANYRLDVETDIEVGIPDVDVSATWHIVRNVETGEDDLIITQYILNKSDPQTNGRTINADAFVVAPNVRQERRLISGLEPGELAVRAFHIPGGARALAGRAVRVGLSSRDSAARLNLLLEIPPLGETIATAAEHGSESE